MSLVSKGPPLPPEVAAELEKALSYDRRVGGRLGLGATREWFERKAAQEGDLEVGAGLAAPRAVLATEKPEPNPEWEARADAAHAAIVAEVGPSNPFDTLTMLEKWKAHAEPADCDGRITFSRAMLDSAEDALRTALKISRNEHLRAEAATSTITALREALEKAAAKFDEYALLHYKKRTEDGDAKALTNANMAAELRTTLQQTETP